MSELINWHEHENDIVGWFILEAIGKYGKEVFDKPGFDSTAMNVTLPSME